MYIRRSLIIGFLISLALATAFAGCAKEGVTTAQTTSEPSATVPLSQPPSLAWDKTFGGAADDGSLSVLQTSDGGYIVLGYTSSFGARVLDIWLIKTDADGNKIWDRAFGGTDEDDLVSAQQTSDGGYIMAGVTNSFGYGEKDAWLVKADADGNKLWDKTFGGTGDDYATSVWQTLDGGYVILGYTNSLGAGKFDFWLIKLAP